MMVLMPPLKVYNHISPMVMITVTTNGMSKRSKMSNCRTFATKKSLNEAPTVLDTKKATEPVL